MDKHTWSVSLHAAVFRWCADFCDQCVRTSRNDDEFEKYKSKRRHTDQWWENKDYEKFKSGIRFEDKVLDYVEDTGSNDFFPKRTDREIAKRTIVVQNKFWNLKTFLKMKIIRCRGKMCPANLLIRRGEGKPASL